MKKKPVLKPTPEKLVVEKPQKPQKIMSGLEKWRARRRELKKKEESYVDPEIKSLSIPSQPKSKKIRKKTKPTIFEVRIVSLEKPVLTEATNRRYKLRFAYVLKEDP